MKMFKTFSELKEAIEGTANKTQEDKRKEIRKLQTNLRSKILIAKLKIILEYFFISELQYEI